MCIRDRYSRPSWNKLVLLNNIVSDTSSIHKLSQEFIIPDRACLVAGINHSLYISSAIPAAFINDINIRFLTMTVTYGGGLPELDGINKNFNFLSNRRMKLVFLLPIRREVSQSAGLPSSEDAESVSDSESFAVITNPFSNSAISVLET